MTRIVFVNRYYAPDQSATSQILADLARHLAGEGFDVTVVASNELYSDPAARLPEAEEIDGVAVRRVHGGGYGRGTLVRRGADYLMLYQRLDGALRRILRRGDILVAKTDPPMLSVVAARAAAAQGAKLVNWVQDVYPEVAGRLGVVPLSGPLGALLARLRDRALSQARANVAVGESMAEFLTARGATDVHTIHNWSDDTALRPVPHVDNPLRDAWNLRDRFVVGYSGNLGRAHEYRTLLDAAFRLRERRDLVFLSIGGGHHLDPMQAEIAARGLDHLFQFQPYQSREQLPQSLGAADVHWLSLRPKLEGLIVPSKFYGIAAAGRPTIAISAADGEIARLVRRHACGVNVVPGDDGHLAATITALEGDREACAAMGARARAMLDERFSRLAAFRRWRSVLEKVAATPA